MRITISQHKPEQADLVWLDREIDYDIALWVRTDSLEPKYPRDSVALIKQTHFELAGAIYAIDYDGQTIIKGSSTIHPVSAWFPLIKIQW